MLSSEATRFEAEPLERVVVGEWAVRHAVPRACGLTLDKLNAFRRDERPYQRDLCARVAVASHPHGLEDAQIAELLHVSERTAQYALRSALLKLREQSRRDDAVGRETRRWCELVLGRREEHDRVRCDDVLL